MSPKIWQIRELLNVSSRYLKDKGIENPRLNAEVLLAHQLHMKRVDLYLNFDQPLTEAELSAYRCLIRRRVGHEPLQYITGVQEFWSLNFAVDPRVLIPRSETELIVEQALLFEEGIALENRPVRILDLGTGCGAIAIAVARELPHAVVWATDISHQALNVARTNASTHGVSDRVFFCQGDLWGAIPRGTDGFDLILSNPPYVSVEEYAALSPEVRDHEPRLALEAGDGGTYFLKRMIKDGHCFLKPGGWIVLEMAPWQTEQALNLIAETGKYGQKRRIKDYSRQYRVVAAQQLRN